MGEATVTALTTLERFINRVERSKEQVPVGTKVLSRKQGKEKRTTGIVVGHRACMMEGCGGTSVCVEWPDKKRTWPCLKGMTEREDGSWEIK